MSDIAFDADKAYAYANANLIGVLGGYNVYSVPEGENLIGKDGKVVYASKGYTDKEFAQLMQAIENALGK